MKNSFFHSSFVLFAVLLFFNIYAAPEKGKLFFDSTKVTLSSNSEFQTKFISTIDKIIDAELFSSRIMQLLNDKEKSDLNNKLSKCQNDDCVAEEAKKMGVALIVKSEISFLADSFKGTLKFYDVYSKIDIAEVPVAGTFENPENIYTQTVKNLVSESQYYFSLKGCSNNLEKMEGFTISQFYPVVDFSGYSKLNAVQEKLPPETKPASPEQMVEFHDLNNVKNNELISAYEQALRADRFGESEPQSAIEAWRKVGSIAEPGVIKDFSVKRENEWLLYNKEIKEAEILKQNIAFEETQQLFPEPIVKKWQDFLLMSPKVERVSFAEKRIVYYAEVVSAIKRYVDEKKNLFENAKSNYTKNIKAMNLSLIKIDKKIDMLLKFLVVYGAVDADFYFVDGLISQIPDEKDKQFAERSVYNKWNAEFFKDKCKNRDYQSCIISEQLYRKIKMDAESTAIQNQGCNSGVLELCAASAQTKLNTPGDLALETMAEKSCVMGSGRGCFALAKFYDIAVMKKPKVKKELLYKVSCERGFEPACKEDGISTESSVAVVKSEETAVLPQPVKKAEKAPAKPRKESEFLKTHPYFWYGFTTALAGVALGAVSIYYGIQTNQNYGDYNSEIKALESLANESYEYKKSVISEKESYMNKLLDDGDKYKKIAIGTGVAGGALIITGTVLMIIKKPQSKNLQLSFIPSENGFMAGAVFSF